MEGDQQNGRVGGRHHNAIIDANIQLNEAGNILAAEQMARLKSKPNLTNRYSNNEDNGTIAGGLFTNVWYIVPTKSFALSHLPPSTSITMQETAQMTVTTSATPSQHERAAASHPESIAEKCTFTIWQTSATGSSPTKNSQNKRAAAYYSDHIENKSFSDIWCTCATKSPQ